jgi:two-component system sensor histidine kinase YesM
MISMMIQCDKSEEAISNINRLSSLLRGMAHWDKDITLEQEIKLLEAYLSIQKSRYEERLEYKIDIDKSLYQYIIPALIMQPIVENAVIHCCESRREKTIITIWSSYEDNIILNIMDNGNGIPVDILNNLKYSLDNYDNSSLLSAGKMNTGSGIGLINVNRRLKLKYGKEFGIFISSTIGQGTLVKIILPKTL